MSENTVNTPMPQGKRTALVLANGMVDGLAQGFIKSGYNAAMHVFRNTAEGKKYLRGEGAFADRIKYPLPSLVILDDATGWEMLEWMRKEPEFMSLYAMILSRSRDPGAETKARELGAALESQPQSSAEYENLAARIGEFWLLG